MQTIFQRYSSSIREIKSSIQERKNLKISFDGEALTFSVLPSITKDEMEKSAKDFFLFIRKNAYHLDVDALSMGERNAILETEAVLTLYIQTYLSKFATVRAILEDEVFCLKLGYLVSRTYVEKNTDDCRFIKVNILQQMFFHHGIRLGFHPRRGIAIPITGSKGIKHEFYYRELKKYKAPGIIKHYHNGEFLFSTDENGVLLCKVSIQNQALIVSDEFMPFIIYKEGYPSAAFDICYQGEDFFVAIHDGEGAVFRFSIDRQKVIYPDQYVYGRDADFKKIHFPATKELCNACIDIFLSETISTKEMMIKKILHLLELENDFHSPLILASRLLSYFYIPLLIVKAIKGEILWKELLTPWKIKKIDFRKMDNYRGDISTTNFS